MEEIDKKINSKKFFSKKSGDGLHHTTQMGVYPRPSLFFQRCQAWPPFLRVLKRTIKKKYTIHLIYIRACARAKAFVRKKRKQKTPGAWLFVYSILCQIKQDTVSRLFMHIFPKFVQKPYKIPIFS